MATLAVSGLPMIQKDNTGSRVAIQSICREHDLGVFYQSIPHLAEQLADQRRIAELRDSVTRQRDAFLFDSHMDTLEAFFRRVIALQERPLTSSVSRHV